MRLEEIRKKRGVTQHELANLMGVRQNTISQWESGKRNPSIPRLVRLAKIFDCTLDDLCSCDSPAQDAERPGA